MSKFWLLHGDLLRRIVSVVLSSSVSTSSFHVAFEVRALGRTAKASAATSPPRTVVIRSVTPAHFAIVDQRRTTRLSSDVFCIIRSLLHIDVLNMALSSIGFGARPALRLPLLRPRNAPLSRHVVLFRHTTRRNLPQSRSFVTSKCHSQQHRKESFGSRLRTALANTKIQWYPIPVGVGIGFLGFLQFQRVRAREKARIEEEQAMYGEEENGEANGNGRRPKRRPRIRPSGPW